MKKTTLNILILTILLACEHEPPKQIAVSVAMDTTDSFQIPPEKQRIQKLFHLNPKSRTEIETGIDLRLFKLCHVDYSQSYDLHIPAVSYRKVNLLSRQRAIKRFYANMDTAFSVLQNKRELSNSSLWMPISAEAHRMMTIPNMNDRYFIIYSDLMENSDWLCLYRELQVSKEVLIKRIEKHIELQDLQGLTIIVRYFPQNTEDNQHFRKVYAVFKTVFEKRGAKVMHDFPNTNY